MITTHGGGTSRKRMHAAKDYSGAEIMRTLRDEVLNRGIPVVDFTAAIEIIKDENGNAAGAVLLNMETKEMLVARAKTVDHRHGRRRPAALSGLPHLQSLRRNGGRPDSGLSCGREAAVCGYAAIPSHGCGVPGADLRCVGDREGAFAGRKAHQRRRRSLHASAGDPRRVRRVHHP